MRDKRAPDVLPPERTGAVGIGNGPAILSKFIVSSFRMSVFDSARLNEELRSQQQERVLETDSAGKATECLSHSVQQQAFWRYGQ